MTIIITTNDIYNLYCIFFILYDNINYLESYKIIIYNQKYNDEYISLKNCKLHNIYVYDFVFLLKKNNIKYDNNIKTKLIELIKLNKNVSFVNEDIDSSLNKDELTEIKYIDIYNKYSNNINYNKLFIQNIMDYLYNEFSIKNNVEINFYNNLHKICSVLIKLNYLIFLYIFIIYMMYKIFK